jgi:hypothetical protein|tara:strand:- start:2748 stop:3095 length:348 start_codon:yes stop_codon:yes gene_type:complete
MSNYNLKHKWIVEFLNPITEYTINKTFHSTIDDIAENYKQINLNTWRNICMGRSKVYDKFIKVSKQKKEKKENINDLMPIVEEIVEKPKKIEKVEKPIVLPRKMRKSKEPIVVHF